MSPQSRPAAPRRPTSGAPGTNAARREAAREKARALREAQARRRRRNRVTAISAGIVVVLVAVALVAWGITNASKGSSTAARPPGVSANDGIVTGPSTAAHTVVIYQDYQCPYCKEFDTSVGPWLEKQRAAGVTTIEYRVVSFLDRMSSGTEYSSRAANAAACVAADGKANYSTFNDTLYAKQPAENGDGLPDSTLISVAEKAGASSKVASCIKDGTYRDWVTQASNNATSKHNVSGTPTVLVDGKVVQGANQGLPTQQDLATALGVSS